MGFRVMKLQWTLRFLINPSNFILTLLAHLSLQLKKTQQRNVPLGIKPSFKQLSWFHSLQFHAGKGRQIPYLSTPSKYLIIVMEGVKQQEWGVYGDQGARGEEVRVKVEEESPAYRRVDKPYRRSKHRPGRFSERPSRVNLDSNFNFSLWSINQNAAYMYFLEAHSWLFERSNSDRRLLKINVLMSLWVKTRSPDQCRSHHQKMMKYHSDIPTIIAHIHNCMQQPRTSMVKMEHEEVKVEVGEGEGEGVRVKVEEEKEGVSSNDF